MLLRTEGTVLGVRAQEPNKRTGELSRWKTLDLYTEDGPAELRLEVSAPDPEPGSRVSVKVGVTAYSGFVKNTQSGEGVAGDAKLMFTALEVTPARPSGARAAEPKSA